MITRKQCDDLMDLVSQYFCSHCSPSYCSEAEKCDIQNIFDILSRNVERELVNEEDEKLPFELEEEDELI